MWRSVLVDHFAQQKSYDLTNLGHLLKQSSNGRRVCCLQRRHVQPAAAATATAITASAAKEPPNDIPLAACILSGSQSTCKPTGQISLSTVSFFLRNAGSAQHGGLEMNSSRQSSLFLANSAVLSIGSYAGGGWASGASSPSKMTVIDRGRT